MNEIIMLQNSSAFTVDINHLYFPDKHNLHLIVNSESFAKLKERAQDKLFSNIHVTEDFSFNTLLPIVQAIVGEKQKQNIFIITNSEWCVAVCGQLRDHFGIKGLDYTTALNFTNKLEMKKALKDSELRLPKYLYFDDKRFFCDPKKYFKEIIKTLGLPIFAKPIDDANSNFTSKINSEKELLSWTKIKEPHKVFELDEFLDGTLYHVDTFKKDNKIILTQVGEYSCPPYYFLKGFPQGTIILPTNHPITGSIFDFNEKVLQGLNHTADGAIHLELFKIGEELIFLEIAARAGGACLPKIYKKYLNINFFETSLLIQIDPNFNIKIDKGPFTAALFYPYQDGEVKEIKLPPISSHFTLECNAEKGEKTTLSRTAKDIAASIILWNNNFDILYKDFCMLKNQHILY